MSNLTADERKKLPLSSFGDPDKRDFPILDQDDVDSAAHLIGKATDKDAVKKRILRIAKRLKLTPPEAWTTKAEMAADDLTADDIRNALVDALGDIYPQIGYGLGNSVWVEDFNPMKQVLYFYLNGDLYSQSYMIDDTGTATLTGTPTDVARRTVYVPETSEMAAFQLGEMSKFGDDFIYEGEIFRAGDYPDKGVSAPPEVCAAFAKATTGTVPAKIQHMPTVFDKALEGYGLERIEPRDGGKWLWGRARFPGWLREALGKNFAVSVGLAKDGSTPTHIKELSIVVKGRVSTAKLATCFAEFAGARHSKADLERLQSVHDACVDLGADCDPDDSEADDDGAGMAGTRHSKADLADIQAMHDLACKQGAACKASGAQMGAATGNPIGKPATSLHNPAPATLRKAKEKPMEALKRFFASFAKNPQAIQDATGLSADEVTQIEAELAKFQSDSTTVDPAVEARFAAFEAGLKADREAQQKELEALRARNAALNTAALDSAAANFADTYAGGKSPRVKPEKRQDLIDLFKDAVTADGGGTANFSDEGKLVTGAAGKRLEAMFEALPVDPAFKDAIFNHVETPRDDVQGGDDAAMLERQMAATPLAKKAAELRGAGSGNFSDDKATKIATAVAAAVVAAMEAK